MEFPSKSLLLSLNQDLKIINNINKKIISNYKSIEINSWLQPTKNYNETIEICLTTSSGNKLYLSYLELLIDRIYLMLNLFLKTLDNFNVKEWSKNVKRPKNLSLGATAEYLWKNLKQIIDYEEPICKTNQLLGNRLLTDQYVQTEKSSLDKCNSCGIASTCIEELVGELSANIDAICFNKIRQNLQEDIYDITQQGCMQHITGAITEDLKNFVQQVKSTKIQNENYEAQIKDLTSKYNKVLEANKSLNRSLKKLKKQKLNEKFKKESLIKKIDQLLQGKKSDNKKICFEQNKSEAMLKTIERNMESLTLLSKDNARFKKEIGEALTENVRISLEGDLWKSRFGEVYLENRELNKKLENYKPIIQNMNESLRKIGDSYADLTAKLEKYNIQIREKAQYFENFLQKLKVMGQVTKKKDVKVEVATTLSCVPSFQLTGNPVHDMQQQIQINISNITKLQQDNNRLFRTITKFQQKTMQYV